MSLGLRVAGRLSPDADRDRLGRWLVRRFDGAPIRRVLEDGDPAILVSLHPAAGNVSLRWTAPDRLELAAVTSAAGPGYHAHVVELLDDLARQFGVLWDPPDPALGTGDDTGYLASRDPAALRRAMLGWLRTSRALFPAAARERTVLGPRDAAFWADVAAGRRDGGEVFPWLSPGHGAAYHLGIAGTLLWTEVRWRPPVTDGEHATLRRVADELFAARALEPTIPLPYAAWAEVLDLLGERGRPADEIRALAAAAPPGAPIGWRRGPVRVPLPGGWSVVVPGDFAEAWQEETWSSWGGGRAAWFTGSRRAGASPGIEDLRAEVARGLEADAAATDAVEVFVRDEAALRGVAALARAREAGEPTWLLRARLFAPPSGRVAACTLCFRERDDLAWALETWRSVSGCDSAG